MNRFLFGWYNIIQRINWLFIWYRVLKVLTWLAWVCKWVLNTQEQLTIFSQECTLTKWLSCDMIEYAYINVCKRRYCLDLPGKYIYCVHLRSLMFTCTIDEEIYYARFKNQVLILHFCLLQILGAVYVILVLFSFNKLSSFWPAFHTFEMTWTWNLRVWWSCFHCEMVPLVFRLQLEHCTESLSWLRIRTGLETPSFCIALEFLRYRLFRWLCRSFQAKQWFT